MSDGPLFSSYRPLPFPTFICVAMISHTILSSSVLHYFLLSSFTGVTEEEYSPSLGDFSVKDQTFKRLYALQKNSVLFRRNPKIKIKKGSKTFFPIVPPTTVVQILPPRTKPPNHSGWVSTLRSSSFGSRPYRRTSSSTVSETRPQYQVPPNTERTN